MFVSNVSFNGLTVISIDESNIVGKRSVSLNSESDKAFRNEFGPRGTQIELPEEKVDSLGLIPGTKVDYSRTDYVVAPSEFKTIMNDKELERRDRRVWYGILNALTGAFEVPDQDLEKPIVVVDERIALAQENNQAESDEQVEGSSESQEDVQTK